MTNKSPDASQTESIFASGEVAEQWRRGAVQRDEVTGPASEMMLDLAKLGAGSRVLDVAAGTGIRRSWRLDGSDRWATYWPRTILLAC